VLLADSFSEYALPAFSMAHAGVQPPCSIAWLAVLAYTLQIYFDFSGYSDMAIGLSRLFGIKLPVNFNSPYKSPNIVEFWRRWHMTLSQFLRDYLYLPLGGNRHGKVRRHINLMTTMLLGGLWHGANWTFVLWGFYHGALLVIHRLAGRYLPDHSWLRPFNIAGTFLAVCIGWVFFRAASLHDAWLIIGRMFVPTLGTELSLLQLRCVAAILVATALGYAMAGAINLRRLERSVPAIWLGSALAGLLLIALLLVPEDGKTFLYFQF